MHDLRPLRGREESVLEITRLLSAGGPTIVTLTGLPGVGKTRLARQSVAPRPDDPSWAPRRAIDVGPRPTPEALRPRALAVAAGLVGRRSSDEDATAVLAASELLLVVDDIDGTGAAPQALAAVLAGAPRLRALVTARAPLHLPGEHVVRIDPLPVPPADLDPSELAANPAVRLFLDVADAVGVPIGPDALADVAAVCAHVGGLPLAIEVAASRTVAFSPGALRQLLERRSTAEVLSPEPGGPDLFGPFEWSTSLLPPRQRRLLRHLATFHRAVPVVAIEDVVGDGHVIEDLGALVEAQLVDADHSDGRTRFGLHPLIREHALRDLGDDADDADGDPWERHRRWASGIAEHEVHGRTGRAGDVRADEVQPDLVAALHRSLEAGDGRSAALLALALAPGWSHEGMSARRQKLLADAAAAAARDAGSAGLEARLRGHLALTRAEALVSDEERRAAARAVDDAVELARKGSDADVLAVLRLAVQAARMLGNWDDSAARCAEGIDLARSLGDEHTVTRFEIWAAMIAHQQGRVEEAARRATSALHRARLLDDLHLVVTAGGLLRSLPAAVRPPGAPAGPELLEAARETGDQWALVWLLPVAAGEALTNGDDRAAAAAVAELVGMASEAGAWAWTELATASAMRIADVRGEDAVAACFHGVIAGRLPVLASTMPPAYVSAYERGVTRLRSRMGAEAFERAIHVGAGLSNAAVIERLLAYTRSVIDSPQRFAPRSANPLTAREREVLDRLVAGDTNRELAAHLGISTKTAMHHTSSIYRKLQVRGRAGAVAWAVRDHIPG